MGATYYLYNFTRRERVGGSLPAFSAREFIWNEGAGAVVLWYMLKNRGDRIAFVSDYDVVERRVVFGERVTDKVLNSFKDVTEEYIKLAINAKVVTDHGIKWQDELDPSLFTRDIRVDRSDGPLPSDGL